MAKPIFDWQSVHAMHLSTNPPPAGRVWWVAKLSRNKRPSLVCLVNDEVRVVATFKDDMEAEAFAGLMGGVDAGRNGPVSRTALRYSSGAVAGGGRGEGS